MAKNYTWEMATNSARGIIKIGNREFVDRRFTIAEKKSGRLNAETAVDFLVIALNLIKVSGEEVTVEWIETTLTEEEVVRLFNWCVHGTFEVRPADAGA